MTFYAAISRWYDELFPADPQTVRFLAGLLGAEDSGAADGAGESAARFAEGAADGAGRSFASAEGGGAGVLDIACGTGGYALELARLGHSVTGIDLDGSMIERARRKAEAAGAAGPLPAGPPGAAGSPAAGPPGRARFLAGDMLRLAALCPGPFHLAFCIGNSLVHLADEGEVGRFLESCRRVLRPGGRLAVQIINYDRILDRRVTELPEIRPAGGALRFIRRYEWDTAANPPPARLQFATELVVQEEGKEVRLRNRVPLLILRAGTLRALAAGAGFGAIALYGDFQGGPLTEDSFLTVLTAQN